MHCGNAFVCLLRRMMYALCAHVVGRSGGPRSVVAVCPVLTDATERVPPFGSGRPFMAIACGLSLWMAAQCLGGQPASAQSTAPRSEPPRAARSVHLGYVGVGDCVAFYNEVIVERSTPGSYFMVCGFRHGYFGIQEQSKGRKVVIFSVWDPTKGDDPNQVPLEQRVEVLHKDPEVEVRRFGGEGTGGQSFYQYDWRLKQTYRFLVKAEVADRKTAYSGYFYLPEKKQWKHLVTFRTTTGGDRLHGLYSFIEDFRRDTRSAAEVRRAMFGNGWVCDTQGRWTPLGKARFTASSAVWEAKETIDAGVAGSRFYLQTGADTRTTTPLGSIIALQDCPASPPADTP